MLQYLSLPINFRVKLYENKMFRIINYNDRNIFLTFLFTRIVLNINEYCNQFTVHHGKKKLINL